MSKEKIEALTKAAKTDLRDSVEKVCKFIDNHCDAYRYQLFQGDDYRRETPEAVRNLNGQLKRMLRKIKTLPLMPVHKVQEIVIEGMQDVRDKYGNCGADESEVRWVIEDVVEQVFIGIDLL